VLSLPARLESVGEKQPHGTLRAPPYPRPSVRTYRATRYFRALRSTNQMQPFIADVLRGRAIGLVGEILDRIAQISRKTQAQNVEVLLGRHTSEEEAPAASNNGRRKPRVEEGGSAGQGDHSAATLARSGSSSRHASASACSAPFVISCARICQWYGTCSCQPETVDWRVPNASAAAVCVLK